MKIVAVLFCSILVSMTALAEGINDQVVKEILEFTINKEMKFSSVIMNKGVYREYSEYISLGKFETGKVRSLNAYECAIYSSPKVEAIQSGQKFFATSALVQRQTKGWRNEGDSLEFTDLIAISVFSSPEKADLIDNTIFYLECRLPVAHFATVQESRSSKIPLGPYDGELNLPKLNRILAPFIAIRPLTSCKSGKLHC